MPEIPKRFPQHTVHSTQHEQRTPSHGDFLRICQTFCVTVRIILNEFVYRMWYVVSGIEKNRRKKAKMRVNPVFIRVFSWLI